MTRLIVAALAGVLATPSTISAVGSRQAAWVGGTNRQFQDARGLEQKITGFESSGSSHGFYMLFIGKYNVGTYSFDWFSHHATSVFSVEVAQRRTKGAYSGRILAINTPTTPTM